MKQQTFIAFFKDSNGEKIDFERFSCRRAETVKKYIEQLWKSALYRACTKGAETVSIYATPDGIHEQPEPVAVVDLATIDI